jgi:hypothetical protein
VGFGGARRRFWRRRRARGRRATLSYRRTAISRRYRGCFTSRTGAPGFFNFCTAWSAGGSSLFETGGVSRARGGSSVTARSRTGDFCITTRATKPSEPRVLARHAGGSRAGGGARRGGRYRLSVLIVGRIVGEERYKGHEQLLAVGLRCGGDSLRRAWISWAAATRRGRSGRRRRGGD